jgi:hypothetical protein
MFILFLWLKEKKEDLEMKAKEWKVEKKIISKRTKKERKKEKKIQF